ncbi:uncharacterized protein A1O9_09228 [Exophiala aquamarina CBS 119918]|uniref:Zn(2)-C6 fungal-type domain-containing protein n=1 Tax=Exophiala aquamarina CBS 119918 TaxID=1182545 RepID=A0A072P4P5_9EURO|nr:uncharacterized protein A1O9_09228 [Exophiala aquamarina CBS 119918]KEF54786.1 hypothetical protein A1O9_09228 [Exophiala aquamarina CBS 119918]
MSVAGNAKSGACERCYRRKARCSRDLPTCSSCAKANTPCIYTVKEGPIRRQDMERLERRLRYLESRNKELNDQLQEARQVQSPTAQASFTSPASNMNSTREDIGRPPENSEVVHQVSYLSLCAGGERQFLGTTSGLLLANLLQTTLLQTNLPSASQPSNDQRGSEQFQRPGSDTIVQNASLPLRDSAVLPPLHVAKGLLAAYCNHDIICYPFLDANTLGHAFDVVYNQSPQDAIDPLDDFIVDMILAIGTAHVHKFDWHAFPDAETHYNRAITRFSAVFTRGGIPALQAVLLICQYRMGSSSFDTSTSLWHLIGVAARMCFELGLHKKATFGPLQNDDHDLAAWPRSDQEIVEIKRRCFWCVLAMDRVASFVLGRPLAIQLDDVDTELPFIDTNKLSDPQGFSSPNEAFDSPKWHLKTLIFVHIVRYRIICGKILTSLHRDTKSTRESIGSYEAMRNELAMELESWHEDSGRLPLTTAAGSTTELQSASSFTSKEWHELLYHNGILMLFRPSRCLSDAGHNSATLQHIFNSSQQSISLYAFLHRSRRINYSWVTLHSVFISGLSYIYALRYHFQNLQRPDNPGNPPRAKLPLSPTINQVVNDTRACSNVLVAVSERWSTARSCSQVFDKLSDAVLTDVVEAQTRGPGLSATVSSHPHDQGAAPNPLSSPGMSGILPAGMSQELGYMAVDSTLQDCFGDLQSLCIDQYGSDAIAALSQDWLFGIQDPGNGYW